MNTKHLKPYCQLFTTTAIENCWSIILLYISTLGATLSRKWHPITTFQRYFPHFQSTSLQMFSTSSVLALIKFCCYYYSMQVEKDWDHCLDSRKLLVWYINVSNLTILTRTWFFTRILQNKIFGASDLSEEFTNRNSRPELFCRKDFLSNFTKFTGKYLCQSLFFK